MDNSEWDEAILAYRRGLRADLLRGRYQGRWGTLFTIPSNASEAARKAVVQFGRTHPEALRHTRHAILRSAHGGDRQVVLVTELPGRTQRARDLTTSEDVKLRAYLSDAVLEVLEEELKKSL